MGISAREVPDKKNAVFIWGLRSADDRKPVIQKFSNRKQDKKNLLQSLFLLDGRIDAGETPMLINHRMCGVCVRKRAFAVIGAAHSWNVENILRMVDKAGQWKLF